MKRIITVLVAAVLLVTCLAFPVGAASDGVVKVGRVSAKPGDEITIPVSYVENPGVYVMRVTVSYDTRVVEFLEISQSASDKFNYTINSDQEGKLIVVMDGQRIGNVTNDIKLFDLKFKVKEDAEAGRALFPVYCPQGDATSLNKVDGKYETLALAPATSSGAVTVLCNEHTFDLEMSDGSAQCSKCGAIKSAEGKVSVDTEAGLPEIDISSSVASAPEVSSENSDGQESVDGNQDNGGLKVGHFIPIIAAVLIVVVIIVAFVTKKKKNTSENEE